MASMRRLVLQSKQLVQQPLPRRLIRGRSALVSLPSGLVGRRYHTSREKNALQTLRSAMHLGRISVAVISTVVASGAYYAYRGTPLNGANGETSYFSFDHMNFWSDSKARAVAPSQGSDSQDRSRRALVIDRGQIFTEELAANERLHKDTDDYGRKVLEMMTPEQATERIRKNEASWHVGRGNGVIRYDVVQLPSNDPIEDDHAEKIIELPTDYSGQADGTSAGDWMFWGVFDGHR